MQTRTEDGGKGEKNDARGMPFNMSGCLSFTSMWPPHQERTFFWSHKMRLMHEKGLWVFKRMNEKKIDENPQTFFCVCLFLDGRNLNERYDWVDSVMSINKRPHAKQKKIALNR